MARSDFVKEIAPFSFYNQDKMGKSLSSSSLFLNFFLFIWYAIFIPFYLKNYFAGGRYDCWGKYKKNQVRERNITQKQLGEIVGASEAYVRAYESGRYNPKPKSLETIAKALAINVEILIHSDFDGIKTMHRLFQVFRQYDGQLIEYQYQDGNDMVSVSFGTLSLMRSWCDRYEKYMKEVEKCNSIKNVKKRGEVLLKAEADFNFWMDIYSESEPI